MQFGWFKMIASSRQYAIGAWVFSLYLIEMFTLVSTCFIYVMIIYTETKVGSSKSSNI